MARYFKTPFADAGDRSTIPEGAQPDGSVSFAQGYGPNYALDPATNPSALDIERSKMNQLFWDICLALRQYQELGTPDFITPLMNGGLPFEYIAGARVLWDDGSGLHLYQSLVSFNTAVPSDNTKWARLDIVGDSFTTGDVKLTLKTAADIGWVMCNDGTIGSASSGATTRANADCENLYSLLWNNVTQAFAPVTGGRGVSASADFAANKPIALTKMLGRALGLAGSGSGLSTRGIGETVGAETVAISTAQMPTHTHTVTDPGHAHQIPVGSDGIDSGQGADANLYNTFRGWTTTAATGITVNSAGSGQAHNNMQPTSFLNAMIKL